MAYKRSKGKLARRKKVEPSVQTVFVNTPTTTVSDVDPNFRTSTSYIDLSQVASLMNRRFYRQGINWAVAGFKIVSGVPGNVLVSKLPNTWVMSNAWEKGFRAWQKMNNDALEEAESVRPRFLDFKIYADEEHHALGFDANLLPKSVQNALTFVEAIPGEWVASSVKIPYTDNSPGNIADREIIAVGGNYTGTSPVTGKNAVSLLEGYANSRALPNVLDPNVPADAADTNDISPENWIGALINDGTNQSDRVLNDMIDENNIAPYPFENDGVHVDTMYPNGPNQLPGLEMHDFSSITGTTVGGITRMKGGMFPCGLIRIDHTQPITETTANLGILIDLVPGNHRGYMCESMTEM